MQKQYVPICLFFSRDKTTTTVMREVYVEFVVAFLPFSVFISVFVYYFRPLFFLFIVSCSFFFGFRSPSGFCLSFFF
jgi:hypothetical protein